MILLGHTFSNVRGLISWCNGERWTDKHENDGLILKADTFCNSAKLRSVFNPSLIFIIGTRPYLTFSTELLFSGRWAQTQHANMVLPANKISNHGGEPTNPPCQSPH